MNKQKNVARRAVEAIQAADSDLLCDVVSHDETGAVTCSIQGADGSRHKIKIVVCIHFCFCLAISIC